MSHDKIRDYIDQAHLEFDRLKESQTSSGTAQDHFNQAILETLHKVIHALDSIERRVGTMRQPAPSKIATVAGPVVKREAERARALLERGRGRVLRFQRRLSRSVASLRRTDDTAEQPPEELQREIAELRGDVRSVRDAMEALAKRLENTGPLRN